MIFIPSNHSATRQITTYIMKQENKKNNITMTDVAIHAGVSQMTVSRVLRGELNVSETVIETVMKSVNELGYVHNKIAGALGNDTNTLVGIALPTMKNRVFNEVLEGINHILAPNNIQSVFGITNYNLEEEEKFIQDILAWRPSGIILCGLEHTEKTIKMLENSSTKVVEIMDTDQAPLHSAFGFSNYQTGYIMAQKLIKKGYKNIAFLGVHKQNDYRAIKRYKGFHDALKENNLDWALEVYNSNISSTTAGRELMEQAIKSNETIDAVYCSNDDLAVGAYFYCWENNIKIPNEVAISSCGGLPIAQDLPQPITTIWTPRYDIGKQAAEYIISEDTTPKVVNLEFKYIEGSTA